uniref:Sigma E regulatory protein, MucB/RseB n=1 Tax=uncultured Thiotrichaceae bacterium TaxID=298394 RepID=A0A6S6S3A8_9GAMM|nr:MAG: Sigma E regulatory protein, MucB/RseB [uncultured Thiotrichaceae bacterium]
MITTNRVKLLAAAVLLLSASGVQAASDEGEQLLKSMQAAVHSLSYDGKLVFWKGNEMSEYHIEHRSEQGNSSESVIQLNIGNDATEPQRQQFSLVNSSSLQLPAQQVYSIDMGRDAQIAGLPCKVVVIRPKDKMRYLYRYCIHQDSGMLLKYSVMNRGQELLEQFMFTQLTIDPAKEQLQLAVKQAAMPNTAEATASISQEENIVSGWDLSQLPAGFTVHQVRSIPGKDNAHQVILSDGLTFVSVFIEPGNSTSELGKKARSSGATNILTVQVAGHAVTMVGEVPDQTLYKIKNGLRYVAP